MDKGMNLTFPKKGDLGKAKNYRGITLTYIAAKIFNVLLLNCIEPQIKKNTYYNRNDFWGNRSTTSQIFTIRRIHDVQVKSLKATQLFVDFFTAFDSRHRGKMWEIILAHGLPKEIDEAIVMLYKNMKVKFAHMMETQNISP